MRVARPVTITVLLLLVSCGDSTGPETFPGTYVLQAVDGEPLPYLVAQAGSDKLEVTAGLLRIESDNTFTFSLTFLLTDDGNTEEATDDESGTWAVTGSVIALTSDDGTSRTGTKSGNVIIVANAGVPWVFEK